MKSKVLIACLILCLLFIPGLIIVSYADTAEVLPKGVFSIITEYSYYWPIDKKFDPDGNEEDLATDFNTSLNNNVFPDLGLVEMGFGMPEGSASLGDSVVDFEYEFDDFIMYFFYGLTENISIGIQIPYYWNKNNVSARLDTENATVGKNPDVPGGIAPLDVPGTETLTTTDIQNLLVSEYGYEPIENWSGSGIGDMEIGARYQYLKTDNWRLAFLGGARLPTGEVDDPDNLADIGFGTGAWALLFRLNNDYTGLKNTVLNATFEYDLYLEDSETKRVPDDVNRPITSNKEKVDRDLGDIFRLNVSGEYSFTESFGFYLEYEYGHKVKDDISGSQGYYYQSLEDETDWSYHEYKIGINYSTFSLFKQEKFPIPITASFEYANVFKGDNNFLEQDYLTVSLSIFF